MTNLPCIQKQQRLFAGYYHQSSPCSLLYLCLISRLSDVVLFFFALENRSLYLLSHCEDCLLKAFDTHRNSSPTYPTTTPSSVACSVADRDRQTDRQELRGQDQKSTLSGAWRLWSDTAIRSGAPALQPDLRGDDLRS